jgi:hypothetical protein
MKRLDAYTRDIEVGVQARPLLKVKNETMIEAVMKEL